MATAETYSMVGRSLPLALLYGWVKYNLLFERLLTKSRRTERGGWSRGEEPISLRKFLRANAFIAIFPILEAAKRERLRRSRAEIAELVASYRQSGQRQREFCQHWAGLTSERWRYDHRSCSG
jgi:hypothetical protein